MNCKVEITETLKFDKTLDYKTKSLDLFQTLRKAEKEFINEDKLQIMVSKMADTHLKNSLSTVKYCWKDYPLKEVESVFLR